MPNKLSVAIITFNEEKNIERCLLNIKDIADEIVVVDSCSTDSTPAICQKHEVKFYTQAFLGYQKQKQLAESLCSHQYILSIDADECPNDILKQQIQNLKQNGFNHDGYKMNVLTSFCGTFIKHGAWYPDTKLRLYNKQKGGWLGDNIHEKIMLDATATYKKLHGDVLHYSYNSVEEIVTKLNKYTTMQAQTMHSRGKKASAVKLLINPLVAFVQGYIIKRGFLDGWNGLFIAMSIAYQTFLKYFKLLKLQNK